MDKKVFFHVKNGARERQIDTAVNADKIVDSIYPDISRFNSSAKNYSSYSSYKGRLKNKILSNTPLLNVGFLPPEHRNAEHSYVWGYLPLNPATAYTIEMDNPYCLSYYNYDAFRLYKGVASLFLEKADSLNFISDAARRNFLEEFGGRFEDKSSVLYPFVKRRPKKQRNNEGKLNFIFVGLSFRNKGGLELLEAFSSVKNRNIRLHFVSTTPPEIIDRYAKDERIMFYEPMPRSKLLEELYPHMDVFVLPSLYESFGMAFLEAISYGMGVIGVNVYATPELIEGGINGRLLEHPILEPQNYYGKEIVSPLKMHLMEFNNKYLNGDIIYDSLVSSLKEAIIEAADSVLVWQEGSARLYEERFGEEIWLKNLRNSI